MGQVGYEGLGVQEDGPGGCPWRPRCDGSAALLQAQSVEQVLAEAGWGPAGPRSPARQAAQVGGMVPQSLDGLHLLVQVVGLQEVTKLWDKGRSGRAEGLGEVRDPQEQPVIPRALGEGAPGWPQGTGVGKGRNWERAGRSDP